ncbi:MAG: T9SS type A sorting domain-containing protein, partial [Ignavibacteria bacterium]|nr:T9SS type A sorting domain-containing protein [Ignavibacteria bacterium]
DAPIPVELTNFSATVSNSSVTLHWSTATETNSKGFEIERNMLTNGGKEISEWKKIGFVSGNGTSTELNNYSFTDNSLASGNYSYRLKQIDFDGSFAYYWLNETVEVSTPVEFALLQNYPNPFNPVTKIKYAVSIRQYTTLKVYNILGREVATLVNEYQAAGNYEVKFDASNLSSGVYFYKLQSGNFVQTKKLLLMK